MSDLMELEKNDLPEPQKEDIKPPMATNKSTVKARAAKKIIELNRNKIEAGMVESLQFIYAKMTDMDNKLTTLASSIPKQIIEPACTADIHDHVSFGEKMKAKKRKFEEDHGSDDDTEVFEGPDIKRSALKRFTSEYAVPYAKQLLIGISLSAVGYFIKNLYNARTTSDGEDLPNYSAFI